MGEFHWLVSTIRAETILDLTVFLKKMYSDKFPPRFQVFQQLKNYWDAQLCYSLESAKIFPEVFFKLELYGEKSRKGCEFCLLEREKWPKNDELTNKTHGILASVARLLNTQAWRFSE